MRELVMLAFVEKERAAELLPQLQRLECSWSSELQSAVAVEVESDGRLRLTQSELLDPAAGEDTPEWKAFLSAIVPLPSVEVSSSASAVSRARNINEGSNRWLRSLSLDHDFLRNAAALLQPGNSAILAMVSDWSSAMPVFGGFSKLVLHTSVQQPAS